MSVGSIKTLRLSGTTVQADVVVGEHQHGAAITVAVSIPRLKDEELLEALKPLEVLLRERALSVVNTARVQAEVRQQVREQVAAALGPERKRIAANAVSELESRMRDLEHARDAYKRQSDSYQREAQEQVQTIAQLQQELAQARNPKEQE